MLPRDPQEHAARDESLDAGRGRKHLGDERRSVDQVLEVVEDEKQLATPERFLNALDERAAGGIPESESARKLGGDERRIGDPCQVDEDDAVPEPGSELRSSLEREARLPGSARSGQRQEPNAFLEEQARDARQLELTADEWSGGSRQSRARESSPRGRSERRILAQDGAFELDELGRRLDAELVEQNAAGGPVRLERVGLSLRSVEGEHEPPAEAFAVRMSCDERLELRHEVLRPLRARARRRSRPPGRRA